MSSPLTVSLDAALALAVWGLGGAIIGELYPFSTVPMYAAVGADGRRTEGAIPIFLADGKRVPVDQFRGFSGEDPDDIGFEFRCRARTGCSSYPSSMPDDTWISAWVHGHWSGGEPGPVPVQFGYVRVRSLSEGGFEVRDLEVLWEGRAWPR